MSVVWLYIPSIFIRVVSHPFTASVLGMLTYDSPPAVGLFLECEGVVGRSVARIDCMDIGWGCRVGGLADGVCTVSAEELAESAADDGSCMG